MKRHILSAAIIAAMGLATSGVVLAAEESGNSGQMGEGTPAEHAAQAMQAPDMSNSYVASKIIGREVQNDKGDKIGKLETVIMDKSGQVTYGVLSQGGMLGMGGKSYVVPWNRFEITADNKVRLNVNKDQVSSEFSAFEPQKPQSTEQESE
jgi:sporulation protein YlmC with PRC-barrel domain